MIKIDTRAGDFGVFQIQEYDGVRIPAQFAIAEAKAVILHCEGKSVLVTSIEVTPNGRFFGKVFGVEPPGAIINGLVEGEQISFEEQHIFSMEK